MHLGIAVGDERQVVEGTQVLAQAIVAVAKRFPDKSIRSAHAVFSRAIVVGPPIELVLDVVAEYGVPEATIARIAKAAVAALEPSST